MLPKLGDKKEAYAGKKMPEAEVTKEYSTLTREQETHAVDIVELAFFKNSTYKEIAIFVSKKFKDWFTGEWDCFIGDESCDCYYHSAYSAESQFIHLKKGSVTIMVTKSAAN